MMILQSKPLVEQLINRVKRTVDEDCLSPTLYLYGADDPMPGVQAYVRGIYTTAEKCGVSITNKVAKADGLIAVSKEYSVPSKSRARDVDGSLPNSEFKPCTAGAIMKMLDYYRVPISGKHVVIVGRSPRVGSPLVGMMKKRDATVTLCNSKTSPELLRHLVGSADIVVSCTGVKHLIHGSWLTPSAVVVDVGSPDPEVDMTDAPMGAALINSIGPVTRAVLMEHVLIAAGKLNYGGNV